MKPVVTPAEMSVIDAEAPEPVEELIERAGWATARAAIELLDRPAYGARIAVLAGKGNNGADGRSAVPHLERRGARCTVFEIGGVADIDARSDRVANDRPRGPAPVTGFDLIVDACYGTGLRRDFHRYELPIDAGDTPVLAVDIPSGVDGLTGAKRGHPLCATATVTFAALKPGLLFGPGCRYAGRVTIADIGLDCSRAEIQLLEPADLVERWPRRGPEAHKWQRAVYVIGGSPGMTGAPSLSAEAALRAGAGYVVRSTPGQDEAGSSVDRGPIEVVTHPVSGRWADAVLDRLDRFGAVVVGPGLRIDSTEDATELARYIERSDTPTVFDAGAIDGLASIGEGRHSAGTSGTSGTFDLGRPDGGPLHVVTPHDGEFTRLTGHPPGPDRIGAARAAAARLKAVVLLKGATTVVAHPDGSVLLSTAGDQRLATAGTGDVLSGMIGAGLAGGLDPFHAAGLAAEAHGLAGNRGYRVGMTAGDLPSQVAALLSELLSDPAAAPGRSIQSG